MAAPSSFFSSSSFCGVDPSLCKYDVFISFRGGDTRHNFTSHLSKALFQNKIRAYVDEESLRKRDDINRALPKAIEESAISIIIFSENFASSSWCLDELVHVLKCKKNKAQIVLPIFHAVDPSDIQQQKRSYGAALVEHEQRFNDAMDKVQEWRQAFIEASGLSGWDSWGKPDSELVEAVVQDVVTRLTEIWLTSMDNSNGVSGGAFLSAFVGDLFRRFRTQDFLGSLKGEESFQKLVKQFERDLFSANRLLDDAEEEQLANAAMKGWLADLEELIFEAYDLMESNLILKPRCAWFAEAPLFVIQLELKRLIAQKDELGKKVISLRSHGEPLVLKSDFYGREDDKEAAMKLVRSGKKSMGIWEALGTENKACKPEVYGREDVKKASEPDIYSRDDAKKASEPDVYGREDAKKADLNAHPDTLSIISEEMGDIGKTNLSEYLNEHPYLLRMGEAILEKCKGHPTAVRSVVVLLRSVPSPDEWRKILESHIWDLQENASKYVLPALWLSYRCLSSQLKRCFAYCLIYPKDYEFTKKEVILLWMAGGFLQPKVGTRMEDVGEEYFKILTSMSFFRQSVHDKSKFTMHDCALDVATFVSFPSKEMRHLSFPKEKIGYLRMPLPRHLRTFLPLESNQSFRGAVPLEELLTEKECLRVLSLSQYPCIAELPNSILESKPLRYLDLSSTSIRNIPDTICALDKLETLLLSNCENLTWLPSEIRRLIKLRHLDFAGSPIKELPPRICELTDLQTLTRFIVCKEHSRIEELGDLQQLHGELEICGLENVVDVKNVSVAKLREKKFLTILGLYWDGESCDGTLKEREILDLLQPHEDLKALRIYGFGGETFPNWTGDQSFGNMVEVQLSECKNCKSLPPLGQLPSLKNLQISGFKSVETIGPEFYSDGSSTTKPFRSLEVLRFEDMAKWEEWFFPKDQVFPCLKELVFYACPELDVLLQDCFPSLTKLLVSHCRELMPLLIPMTHQHFGFQSLEELEIFACPEQVIFLEGGLPSSLKKIKISRCENLDLLHRKNFQHLTSLESLEIIECKELHRLPEELPTYPFWLSIVGGWGNGEDRPN